MPSRNVKKIDVAESYYHVYARGASRQTIFPDDADYKQFLQDYEEHKAMLDELKYELADQ